MREQPVKTGYEGVNCPPGSGPGKSQDMDGFRPGQNQLFGTGGNGGAGGENVVNQQNILIFHQPRIGNFEGSGNRVPAALYVHSGPVFF